MEGGGEKGHLSKLSISTTTLPTQATCWSVRQSRSTEILFFGLKNIAFVHQKILEKYQVVDAFDDRGDIAASSMRLIGFMPEVSTYARPLPKEVMCRK